jgi:hypothetical protein
MFVLLLVLGHGIFIQITTTTTTIKPFSPKQVGVG